MSSQISEWPLFVVLCYFTLFSEMKAPHVEQACHLLVLELESKDDESKMENVKVILPCFMLHYHIVYATKILSIALFI